MAHIARAAIGPPEWFTRVAFSPDDTRLAVASNDHIHAMVIDLEGHVQLQFRHDKPKGEYSYTNVAVFDPSGRRLLTAGSDDTIRIWDAISGDQLLKNHSIQPERLLFYC